MTPTSEIPVFVINISGVVYGILSEGPTSQGEGDPLTDRLFLLKRDGYARGWLFQGVAG
jgi:hypothetical protein